MNAISAEFSDVSPLAQAKALFKQAFDAEPAWAVRAPGRVPGALCLYRAR